MTVPAAPASAPVPDVARNRPVLAVLYMLCASALIAASTLFAKAVRTDALGPALHPFQATHGRFVFALIVFAGAVAILRPRFVRPHIPLHLARTACGFTGVTLMFAAVAFIPLGTATALSFLNPIFAMLFAIVLLRERVGVWRWSAAAVALTGAVVLLQPAGGVELGALLALAAAVALGLEISPLKMLSRLEPPLTLLLVNNVIGTAIASVAVVFVFHPPTLAQWGALAGIGFTMAGAQFCFVNALARADASFVVPFSYATLVFATLYDVLAFATLPEPRAFFGAAIIIAGGAVLLWREGRQSGPRQSPTHAGPKADRAAEDSAD